MKHRYLPEHARRNEFGWMPQDRQNRQSWQLSQTLRACSRLGVVAIDKHSMS
jgi:hypothetical protein